LRQAGEAGQGPRQRHRGGELARQAGQRLKQLQQDHRPPESRRDLQGWQPAVGDRVRVLALGRAAEVLARSEDGRELSLRCGALRLQVPLEAIEGLQGEKPQPPAPPMVQVRVDVSGGRGPAVRSERNTLDVRGLLVHEAQAAVEEQLRRHSGPMWLVHGVGSGRLREGLRNWLVTLPWVEQVTDAEPAEGGAGCSVVWCR
jgi:DNA mismatch repair protein MutS2